MNLNLEAQAFVFCVISVGVNSSSFSNNELVHFFYRRIYRYPACLGLIYEPWLLPGPPGVVPLIPHGHEDSDTGALRVMYESSGCEISKAECLFVLFFSFIFFLKAAGPSGWSSN